MIICADYINKIWLICPSGLGKLSGVNLPDVILLSAKAGDWESELCYLSQQHRFFELLVSWTHPLLMTNLL